MKTIIILLIAAAGYLAINESSTFFLPSPKHLSFFAPLTVSSFSPTANASPVAQKQPADDGQHLRIITADAPAFTTQTVSVRSALRCDGSIRFGLDGRAYCVAL